LWLNLIQYRGLDYRDRPEKVSVDLPTVQPFFDFDQIGFAIKRRLFVKINAAPPHNPGFNGILKGVGEGSLKRKIY